MKHIPSACALAGITALAAAGPASASPLRCGDTVTTSVVLHADVRGCAQHGLVIGADGVTVDLNGHTIAGDAIPSTGNPDVGVLSERHAHVTIENGTITGFDLDAYVEQAAASRISGLTVRAGAVTGILARNSTGVRIDHNDARGNAFVGIDLLFSTDSTASGNVTADNEEGVTRAGDGVVVAGDGNRIERNLISDTRGCPDGCGGFGITGEGGAGNVIAENVVNRTSGTGIRLDAYASPIDATVVRGNVVHAAGADGVAIGVEGAGPVTHTLLERNLAVGSRDDGFDVRDATATLTGNLAFHSGGLGFRLVPGVTVT